MIVADAATRVAGAAMGKILKIGNEFLRIGAGLIDKLEHVQELHAGLPRQQVLDQASVLLGDCCVHAQQIHQQMLDRPPHTDDKLCLLSSRGGKADIFSGVDVHQIAFAQRMQFQRHRVAANFQHARDVGGAAIALLGAERVYGHQVVRHRMGDIFDLGSCLHR